MKKIVFVFIILLTISIQAFSAAVTTHYNNWKIRRITYNNTDTKTVTMTIKNNNSLEVYIAARNNQVSVSINWYKDKVDELKKWMEENEISVGINIDEDTKRYYPYNNLASNVIGFCGSDNQGLDGIEAKYDDELKGKKGSIKRQTDAKGGEIGNEGEEYIAAVDGNDLVLTIDLNIQSIVEKYLEEACIDNKCTDGGNVIVMNPQNGDILAMATYPSYNLNQPFEPYTEEQVISAFIS